MLTKKLWENTNCLISVFHPFANICLYLVRLKNVWFIGAQIWPYLISNEWVLDISQIFGLFGLAFKIQIWRWNKIYCSYLDSKHFIFFITYEWAQKVKGSVPGRLFQNRLMFRVHPRLKHLKGASLGCATALLANNRLGL